MAYEPKEGYGAMHKNDKGGVETRPDYRGDLMVGGTMYEVAGWIKDGAKGKFMSLKAGPKQERAPKPAPEMGRRVSPADDEDDGARPF